MADVLILYQISNEFTAKNHSSVNNGYNAFYLPRKNNGITLSAIKNHIRSSLGHDQYHWRVRIEDRPNTTHGGSTSSSSSDGAINSMKYSWWDIQDENARLPIKEATPKELKKMFGPPKKEESGGDVTQEVTKVAKGAMKYVGKAMNAVASSAAAHHGGFEDDGIDDDFGQRTAVICFKVLDLNRVRRAYGGCGSGFISSGGGGARRVAAAAPRRATSNTTTATSASSSSYSTPAPQQQQRRAPASAGAPRIPPHNSNHQQQQRATPAKTSAPTANLMDFGSSTSSMSSMSTTPQQQRQHHHQQQQQRTASNLLHHANSMPSSASKPMSTPTGKIHPNETRAQKLKREYAQKNAQSNRIWDEVDQRWVDGTSKNGEITAATVTAASATTTTTTTTATTATVTASIQGISLSTTNAIGKSAKVQAAVHARVAEMESSQQKAIAELRTREAAKAKSDAEEDLVRQRLEPKLKAWSEEHGQKKQLRALLANLHTILWEGSGWKQVSLADVLDDSKVKRVYHKASRVVHPDKTLGLDAEKKFVAKRVFDALTQAKVEFDEGKR
ncbi:hypothetical protein ACHAXM_001887 [Skeletonema potamos]